MLMWKIVRVAKFMCQHIMRSKKKKKKIKGFGFIECVCVYIYIYELQLIDSFFFLEGQLIDSQKKKKLQLLIFMEILNINVNIYFFYTKGKFLSFLMLRYFGF